MRCTFLYLILCDRHLRAAPQRTGCICRETCCYHELSKRRETRLCHYSASLRPNCFILSGRRSHFDRLLLFNRLHGAATRRCRCIYRNTTSFELRLFVTSWQKRCNSVTFCPMSLIFIAWDRISQYLFSALCFVHI